jgi:hypothetical protein
MRRIVGMDIHRTFGEVVIWENGFLRHAGRVAMTRSAIPVSNAWKAEGCRQELEGACTGGKWPGSTLRLAGMSGSAIWRSHFVQIHPQNRRQTQELSRVASLRLRPYVLAERDARTNGSLTEQYADSCKVCLRVCRRPLMSSSGKWGLGEWQSKAFQFFLPWHGPIPEVAGWPSFDAIDSGLPMVVGS